MNESGYWREVFPELIRQVELGEKVVLVTVVTTQGSSPRDVGSKMLVGAQQCWGSVGGGNLEFHLQQKAREMIHGAAPCAGLMKFNLAASLGQCCGGVVEAYLELYGEVMKEVVVFGAGHVGEELVALMNGLSWKVHWIDSRESFLEGKDGLYSQLKVIHEPEPQDFVEEISPGAAVVILTHSHDLDFQILMHCIKRQDLAYTGLIGSRAKWNRFQKMLLERGFSQERIDQVTCPVGRLKIRSKHPKKVALSIVSQLLETLEDQD